MKGKWHAFFEFSSNNDNSILFSMQECKIKNQICANVFKNSEKPKDYDFRVSLAKVLTEIKNQKLNIDMEPLKKRRHEFKVRLFFRKFKEIEPYICYNMYGAKTGRLTASQFPILTMHKSYRKI